MRQQFSLWPTGASRGSYDPAKLAVKAQAVLISKAIFEPTTHKGEAVIFIRFDYDAALIARVKKLVGVEWSQTQKAWYVKDTEQYRQKFGLAPKRLGEGTLLKIDPVNQADFKTYMETLRCN